MFVVFEVDYLDYGNKDFFNKFFDEKNNKIKYNINIDDMTKSCFFVAFMNTEEEAKKFCEVRNQYNELSDFDDAESLRYYSYCKYYEDQPLVHTIIEMQIRDVYWEKNKEIQISFYIHHPDKISKDLLDEFIRNRNVDIHNPTLFITPEENESPKDVLNRGLDKCVEFIKKHEFTYDGKIYTYKDFLYYDKEEHEGGIFYTRWDYAEMIHIEDRFKE